MPWRQQKVRRWKIFNPPLSEPVSIGNPEVCTAFKYKLRAVPGPVWINAVSDELSRSAAFRRNLPNIAGPVSLWRIRSGQKYIEDLVSLRRPSRTACRLHA